MSAALSGCHTSEPAAQQDDPGKNKAATPVMHTLDVSKLPPYNVFNASDLDTSKNACVDFVGYANGKWLAAHEIPKDRGGLGTLAMLQDRAFAVQHQLAEQATAVIDAHGVDKIVGDFWASGMDEARINAQGLTPLKAELAAIDTLNDGPAIAAYLRQNAAKGAKGVFTIEVKGDFKNSSTNMAYATQGGLGLPDRGYYFDTDKKAKLAAYQTHVANVLQLSGLTAADAAEQAKDVIALETRLAKVSKSKEQMSRDAALEYNPITPAAADALTPNFPWSTFFQAQGVPVPQTFSLAIPAFHQEVSNALGDTDPAVWRAYLRFHSVDDAAPYLSDAFVQEDFAFYGKQLFGRAEMEPRWKRVIGSIEDGAGDAMGQMYVKVAFSPDAKAKMLRLVDTLRQALKLRIERLTWMSEDTKARALAKWATFTPKIGYPDKWRDTSGLITQRDSYLANVHAAAAFNYTYQLSKIGKTVDKTEWEMTPQTANAYYTALHNEIVFPAAILQPPFFDPNADDAINYGGIGAVIGHEMTHAYDDQGSRFGPDGNFIPDPGWWTPKDLAAFKTLTGMLVQQFDAYALDGKPVNGNLTLGENIADLGGLSTAYDAMKKATAGTRDPMVGGMTRDQNFFLNWATVWRAKYTPQLAGLILAVDTHAPGQFRAMGAPSNMPAFATAFSCKPGDPMVRAQKDRVVIW